MYIMPGGKKGKNEALAIDANNTRLNTTKVIAEGSRGIWRNSELDATTLNHRETAIPGQSEALKLAKTPSTCILHNSRKMPLTLPISVLILRSLLNGRTILAGTATFLVSDDRHIYNGLARWSRCCTSSCPTLSCLLIGSGKSKL